MKFVRFGALTLQKQTQYKEPTDDMWSSTPPCRKGFFAFPAGYMDPFYLPLSRPPEEPHSLLQYLRDDNGAKMTRHALYDGVPKEGYGGSYYEPVLSARGREFLKKRHLKEKQLFWIERPSWVMICASPWNDLSFFGLGTPAEDRSRLNQPLKFLLDPDGEKIPARHFFYPGFYERFPENYEGGYDEPVPGDDFDPEGPLYAKDGKSVKIEVWLKQNGVKPETLCIWPVYPKLENEYAGTLKKYRMFEYDGCLWHHLGMFLKRSEILGQFSDIWYYTDIHAYERALRKSNGWAFRKKQKYQRRMDTIGYFGAKEWNGTFDQSQMYEVFFDQRIP